VTYAGLAATFLLVPVGLAVTAAVLARPGPRWWVANAGVLVVLLILTAIFDSLMIAADLFRFDEDRLLGVRVAKAPLEDLAWPLASALGLPALWVLLGRRDRRPGDGR
jgi:lycopene cyclase domain-containing protein